MGSTKEHQQLVDDILYAVGSLPSVRAWPRFVGGVKIEDKFVKVGLPGESDIDGLVHPWGRRLCIECKTGNAVLSKRQKLFRQMVLKFGGIYIEARSVEDAILGIKKEEMLFVQRVKESRIFL